MPVTINGSGSISTHTTSGFKLDRDDASIEGGQITFKRSTDNADMYAIDIYGSTATPNLRFINIQSSASLFSMNSSGDVSFPSNNLGIGTPSLGTNGYSRLPNGLLLQWGTSASIAQDSSATVTYPVAFSTAVYSVMLTPIGAINTTSGGTESADTVTITNFVIRHGGDGSRTFYWMAIGV